jgi:hypothetical protein
VTGIGANLVFNGVDQARRGGVALPAPHVAEETMVDVVDRETGDAPGTTPPGVVEARLIERR